MLLDVRFVGSVVDEGTDGDLFQFLKGNSRVAGPERKNGLRGKE
jgi:hypothetical protein